MTNSKTLDEWIHQVEAYLGQSLKNFDQEVLRTAFRAWGADTQAQVFASRIIAMQVRLGERKAVPSGVQQYADTALRVWIRHVEAIQTFVIPDEEQGDALLAWLGGKTTSTQYAESKLHDNTDRKRDTMTENSKNVIIQIETMGIVWVRWAPVAQFTGDRASEEAFEFGEKLIQGFPASDPMRPRVRMIDGTSGDELGTWFLE